MGEKKSQNLSVHRLAWALYNNMCIEDIPHINEKGEILHVAHGQGCPRNCCEGSHLTLKTQSGNLHDDMMRDKTLRIGEMHHNALVSNEQALNIRKIKKENPTKSIDDIANEINVPKRIVANIASNRTYTGVGDADGNKIDNSLQREKRRKKVKESSEQEFDEDDYKEILELLYEKTEKKINKDGDECWLLQKQNDENKFPENLNDLDENELMKIAKKLKIENTLKNKPRESVIKQLEKVIKKYSYMAFRFRNGHYRAHVLAYEASTGKPLDEESNNVVSHKCEHLNCVNPEHLYLETRSNIAKKNPKPNNTTDNEVRQMRFVKEKLLNEIHTSKKLTLVKDISEIFNKNRSTVCGLLSGSRRPEISIDDYTEEELFPDDDSDAEELMEKINEYIKKKNNN